MRREDWPDLVVFAAIAEERSFKKAAAKLGVSTSALSHSMSALEERLGVRLLQRTTRSVAPTEAGERLLKTLGPAMADITTAVDHLVAHRERPAGTLRLTVHRTAARRFLGPRLPAFMRQHPDIAVEVAVEDGWTDIVARRFDAGIRIGESIDKDMVSVRIAPDERAAIVATPEYFTRHPKPRTPHDLGAHRCVNYRHVSSGALYRWEFEKDGRVLNVSAEGTFICNDGDLMITAALGGIGLTYTWESEVTDHLASGALVRVLEDWCPPFPGNFLYYPSRHHVTPALRALIEALRYRP
ncbi:LysR family transcriptional regulator [Chondromyces apiculatus]|uniref:Transcriptional regulator, LysR family n=1 Tax=Chondromyces apiculatus DSM 436 TaxID=1192034 RepID=A0A017T241_9BACT|nr:LysR family transcriptional regulator [Chondromyces apiculatus]EYF02596.1 Transcriptional regulator, LysR family [Chondromyces apiculatus DSM 436]